MQQLSVHATQHATLRELFLSWFFLSRYLVIVDLEIGILLVRGGKITLNYYACCLLFHQCTQIILAMVS